MTDISQLDSAGKRNPSIPACGGEEGLAVLIALIGLSLFSLLGLFMAFNATTDVRISDNYEARIQAEMAAQAGLNHAREVLRGLKFEYHLRGPDGTYHNGASYFNAARAYGFRNPLDWATARSLDIADPSAAVHSLADDGILNTGVLGATAGTPLIPITGIAETAPNPYGSGSITTSRYFVKVTDNNGEATELAGDPADNPYFDGDNIVIVRSMGIARTIREVTSGVVRHNSVAAYEARFIQRTTFDLDAPLVVEGNEVLPVDGYMFEGNSFHIDGGTGNVGIATIDTDTSDGILPSQQISSNLSSNQYDNVSGQNLSPSLRDITATLANDPDKLLLQDPEYLWNLVHVVVPQFADSVYEGDQVWSGGSAEYIGAYDPDKPENDPSQDPRVTYVHGNLDISGNVTGGGLLVVTGDLIGSGRIEFNGLILVIGTGLADGSGLNIGLRGGMFIANIVDHGGTRTFGTPSFHWAGNSNMVMDSDAVSMAVRMLPPEQLGWREVTSTLDPQ